MGDVAFERCGCWRLCRSRLPSCLLSAARAEAARYLKRGALKTYQFLSASATTVKEEGTVCCTPLPACLYHCHYLLPASLERRGGFQPSAWWRWRLPRLWREYATERVSTLAAPAYLFMLLATGAAGRNAAARKKKKNRSAYQRLHHFR
jgi:hypothetical protein